MDAGKCVGQAQLLQQEECDSPTTPLPILYLLSIDCAVLLSVAVAEVPLTSLRGKVEIVPLGQGRCPGVEPKL